MQLLEIRIGEPEDGELHVEVWVTTARDPDDTGHSSQRVLDIPIRFPVPVRD